MHYRGKEIVDAIMKDLLENRGLANATDVVIAGSSAGGLATFLHCDKWANSINLASRGKTKVVCSPDSGYFMDYDCCDGNISSFRTLMNNGFHYFNVSSGIN